MINNKKIVKTFASNVEVGDLLLDINDDFYINGDNIAKLGQRITITGIITNIIKAKDKSNIVIFINDSYTINCHWRGYIMVVKNFIAPDML